MVTMLMRIALVLNRLGQCRMELVPAHGTRMEPVTSVGGTRNAQYPGYMVPVQEEVRYPRYVLQEPVAFGTSGCVCVCV